VLERFDLAVDAVVSGDDFDGPGKPDPALYRRAGDRLGVAPGDAVAVEDSVHGIEAARGAGMTVVGFRFGNDEGTDFADAHLVPAGPEELVASLRELADLA
jgi:beta-phosphoglucomutase-like phosphatase (HAD superfamily)